TASEPVDEDLEDITEIGNPHEPNFEKIAEVNPDVLIVSPSFKQYEDNLKDQGIEPVYTEANSVDDILDTIDVLGSLLDKEDDADEIIASITEYVDEAKSSEQGDRSEEHTSELQSRFDLVCRLLLEKKNKQNHTCTQIYK